MTTVKALKQWTGPTRARALQPHLCHTCRQPILTGYDADLAAVRVWLDPIALTPLGMLQALTSGRRLYLLTRPARSLQATRQHRHLKPPRAGPHDYTTSHQCDKPLPDHKPHTDAQTYLRTSELDPNQPPPF